MYDWYEEEPPPPDHSNFYRGLIVGAIAEAICFLIIFWAIRQL